MASNVKCARSDAAREAADWRPEAAPRGLHPFAWQVLGNKLVAGNDVFWVESGRFDSARQQR